MSDTTDERVWSLHCRGFALSQIAKKLNLDVEDVRAVICRLWRTL